jgi:PDZ domain-containing protein
MEPFNPNIGHDAPEPPEVPAEPTKTRVPLWGKIGIGAAIVTLIVVVAGFLVHVPYTVISPGEAVPLTGLVKVEGAQTFDKPRGDIRLLFVRERVHVSVWRYLQAKLDSDSDILKDQVVNPQNKSPQQREEEGQDQMSQAKEAATKVALQAAGYKVDSTVTVTALAPDTPAANVLRKGDILKTADGREIHTEGELRSQVIKHKAGDDMTLGIVRGGKPMMVKIEVAADQNGRRYIGIQDMTTTFDSPVKVTVDTAGIGGPSGGLAMTLAILDDLTPGDLTGGTRVAVTGTIDFDGNVGEIGGIEQKAVAARAAGAKVFIVPQCSPQDAPPYLQLCQKDLARATKRVGSGVKVVPVSTFDQALDVLHDNGGEAVVPSAPATQAA